MTDAAIRGDEVAKKKAVEKKRYGTLIRVSDEFADAIRDATAFEKMSTAEFVDLHLLAIVRKRYRDAVIKAAKKMEDKG